MRVAAAGRATGPLAARTPHAAAWTRQSVSSRAATTVCRSWSVRTPRANARITVARITASSSAASLRWAARAAGSAVRDSEYAAARRR